MTKKFLKQQMILMLAGVFAAGPVVARTVPGTGTDKTNKEQYVQAVEKLGEHIDNADTFLSENWLATKGWIYDLDETEAENVVDLINLKWSRDKTIALREALLTFQGVDNQLAKFHEAFEDPYVVVSVDLATALLVGYSQYKPLKSSVANYKARSAAYNKIAESWFQNQVVIGNLTAELDAYTLKLGELRNAAGEVTRHLREARQGIAAEQIHLSVLKENLVKQKRTLAGKKGALTRHLNNSNVSTAPNALVKQANLERDIVAAEAFLKNTLKALETQRAMVTSLVTNLEASEVTALKAVADAEAKVNALKAELKIAKAASTGRFSRNWKRAKFAGGQFKAISGAVLRIGLTAGVMLVPFSDSQDEVKIVFGADFRDGHPFDEFLNSYVASLQDEIDLMDKEIAAIQSLLDENEKVRKNHEAAAFLY